MKIRSGRFAGPVAAVVVASLLLAAGCGSDDSGSGDPSEDAQGSWVVESGTLAGEDIPLVADSPITMVIDGDEVSGVSACNNYQTSVTIDGDSIEFGLTAGTLMACEDDVSASEQAFLAAMGMVDTVSVDGEEMTLTGSDAEIVLTR